MPKSSYLFPLQHHVGVLTIKKISLVSLVDLNWLITVFFNYLPLLFHYPPTYPQTPKAASTHGGSFMATATDISHADTPGRTLRKTAGSTMATLPVSTVWLSRTSSEVSKEKRDNSRFGTECSSFWCCYSAEKLKLGRQIWTFKGQ